MALSPNIKKYLGTWTNESSDAEYTIAVQSDKLVVRSLDPSDGEKLRIKNVEFDGLELRLTSICPSTDFMLRHIFRSPKADEVEHEFTRIENWHRTKVTEVALK
jgi:hypothetical protein